MDDYLGISEYIEHRLSVLWAQVALPGSVEDNDALSQRSGRYIRTYKNAAGGRDSVDMKMSLPYAQVFFLWWSGGAKCGRC